MFLTTARLPFQGDLDVTAMRRGKSLQRSYADLAKAGMSWIISTFTTSTSTPCPALEVSSPSGFVAA